MTEAVDKHARPVLDTENRLELAQFGINLRGQRCLHSAETRVSTTFRADFAPKRAPCRTATPS